MLAMTHIMHALKTLDTEVMQLLNDQSLGQNDKDQAMIVLKEQKKILDEALAKLEALKKSPPIHTVCKTSPHA